MVCRVTISAGQEIGAKADDYLSAWAKQGRFSGAMLIAKDGKVLLGKAYGMANYEFNVRSFASGRSPSCLRDSAFFNWKRRVC